MDTQSASDSLNATQVKVALKSSPSQNRRRRYTMPVVCSHMGQEEDLRAALNVVINHVAELSSMLNEAYKAQAELEVQLNVTKSNLQLVIANNEMLEEALEEGNERPHSGFVSASSIPTPTSASAPAPPTPTPQSSQDSRFFRFRFTGSISSRSSLTRPTTPTAHHLTSPSMPVLPTIQTREIEELTSQLEKERTARKTISDEKAALEAELESLSQALFEEVTKKANKMVATERMKRAETEEELKEARLEQEALRSALRLVEGENSNLREASQTAVPSSSGTNRIFLRPRCRTLLVQRTRTKARSSHGWNSSVRGCARHRK
ncbi:hypothetical protein F5887DRAFT_1158768 [Amanita rubescens]|nr:hypothetical protein F5887DRAFT_1158768 [Amanita rubescens]